jgi:hypothetical protein
MGPMTWAGPLAAGIGVLSCLPYIRATVRRTTKPERASWLIWAAEYAVLFAAQIANGGKNADWLVGAEFCCVLVICVLSRRYGTGALTPGTCMLLAGVVLALVLWFVTSNPALAIGLALAVEWAGAILTVRKAYKLPASESRLSWTLAGLAGFAGIWAIDRHNGILYAYPVSLMIMSASVMTASFLGGRNREDQNRERDEAWIVISR